ncbi:MAG TPA: outer membrane beta-barrel protein, partial [Bradyrhizobium sp.]|nr:outer membrane beta-barrel protein [Bradyrhizobium sp.]
DFSWANLSGSSNVCGPLTTTPHPCGTNLNALGTFRGRFGYVAGANGNWLLYATGGVAVGELHGWDSFTPSSGTDWRAGWTAGVGVETAFAPNWTAKLEYLHVDLGSGQVFNVVPGVPESVGLTADIVRAGINYRFGGADVAPAPMYTKAPYTKAPPLAVGNPWWGWYGGVNAGYLDGANTVGTDATVISTSLLSSGVNTAAMAAGATGQLSTGRDGFLGGAQFGYNYIVSPKILAGVEADIQGSSLKGSTSATSNVLIAGGGGDSFVTTIAASRSLDYIGTIRGRLGAIVTPGLLLYATGGLAYGEVKSNTTVNQFAVTANPPPPTGGSGSFSDVRAGYAVGAGGEWMFSSKWSAKLEYLYYDLGSAHYGTGVFGYNVSPTSLAGVGIDAIATSSRVHFDGNIVRVGLNYHFN